MGLYAQTATPLDFREETQGNSGLFGFLKNVWGEGQQLVQGLGGLAGAGLSDFARLVKEGATLGQYEPTHDQGYLLDDIVPKIPGAFVSDLAQRWGPLFEGDIPEFGSQLYEHPLSFGLDFASLGAAPAAIGKRIGTAAVRESPAASAAMMRSLSELGAGRSLGKMGSKLGMEADDIAKFVAQLPAVGSRPYRAVPTAVREGLDVLAQERPLTMMESFAQRMLPQQSGRLLGAAPDIGSASTWKLPTVGEVVPWARNPNPVTRPVEEALRRVFSDSPAKYLEKVNQLEEAAHMRGVLQEGTIRSPLENDIQRMRVAIEEAKTLGVPMRFDKPILSKNALFRAASNWYSGTSSQHLTHRQKDMEKVMAILKPWLKEHPELERVGYLLLNRLEKKLPPEVTPGAVDIPPELAAAAAKHPRDFIKYLKDNVDEDTGMDYIGKNAGPYVEENARLGELVDTSGPIEHRTELEPGEVTLGGPPVSGWESYIWRDENGDAQAILQVNPVMEGAGTTLAAKPGAPSQAVPELLDAVIKAYPDLAENVIRDGMLSMSNKGALAYQRALRRWAGTRKEFQHEPWFERVVSEIDELDASGELAGPGMLTDPRAWLPGKGNVKRALQTVVPAHIRQGLTDLATDTPGNMRLQQVDELITELQGLMDEGHISESDMAFIPLVQDLINGMAERALNFQRQNGNVKQLRTDAFLDDVRPKMLQDAFDAIRNEHMTLEQVLERPYRALRMKYGATSTLHRVPNVDAKGSPLTKEYSEAGIPMDNYHMEARFEGGPDWQDLHESFRASGEAPPVYFPFMSEQRRTMKDWFRATSLKGYEAASADPHFKYMEGTLLKSGDFIRNPLEAYTRRAARGVRADETLETMNRMVQQFGRRITSPDQLGTNEMVAAPKYMFMRHTLQRHFEDKVDELIMGGEDREGAIVKTLNELMPKIHDEIVNGGILDEGMEMYAVPKVVADRLNDAQRFAGFGGKWAKMVDGPMAMWRNVVLLGRPAWVVNNLLGNVLFAKMQGASLTDAMRLLENRYAKLLNERFGWNLSHKFLDELERLPGESSVGTGFFSTLGQFEPRNDLWDQSAIGRALKVSQTKGPRKALIRYGEFIKTVNRELESAFRDASYLTALERQAGMSATKRTFRAFMGSRKRMDDLLENGIGLGTNDVPGAATKLALAEVDQFFGNYTRLSPFERHVVRRFIFPWWGFYRHQLKLITSFPMNYPGRARILQSASLATLDMMNAYGDVPEWLEGAVPLTPPGIGPTEFLSTRGANPFEATFQPWTSQLSPIIKVAMEQAQGRNQFTGNEFSDPDVITPFGSDQAYQIQYENGYPIAAEPTTGARPGIVEHFLQQLPQYQMFKQAAAGGRTYDTTNMMDALFDLFGGAEAARTDETGEVLFPTGLMDQISKLLGFSTMDYDLQQFQTRLADEQQMALDEALRRMAV